MHPLILPLALIGAGIGLIWKILPDESKETVAPGNDSKEIPASEPDQIDAEANSTGNPVEPSENKGLTDENNSVEVNPPEPSKNDANNATDE